MQSLEDLEDPLGVFHVDADAVIFHHELPLSVLPFDGDVNVRRRLLLLELDGVVDQVLEELGQLDGVPFEGGQRIVVDGGVTFGDAQL